MTEELNPLVRVQNEIDEILDDVEVWHIKIDALTEYVVECVASGTYELATLQAMARAALPFATEARAKGWYS